MIKIITLTLCLTVAFAAQAQTPQSMPSKTDIDAQRKKTMEAMNSLGAVGLPTHAQTRTQLNSNAATTSAVGTLPGVKAPPVSKATNDDFMKLLGKKDHGYLAQPPAKQRPDSSLMVFVSLSMPENMLMQYAAQAKRFGAVLVLRGFVDEKLSVTRNAIQKLNAGGAEWDINPKPFKTFKIDKVPAIALATTDSTALEEDGCATPDTYTVIYGDMAIKDALDKMSILGQKKIAALAKSRLLADRAAATKKG